MTKDIYSATGDKLRVIYQTAVPNITVAIGSTRELMQSEILFTDSTDYLLGGALTLRNGRIDKYQFDEGYCQATQYNATQDNFTFLYYDRDHLGNVRQVTKAIGSNGTVVQTMNYYPFGALFCDGSAASSDVQPYRYNGKELDKMHGLNTYDYGARQYNPVTARWDRMDPLCEKYYSISPYVYCAGNPVNVIDPDGKSTWVVNQRDGTYRVIGGDINDKDRNIYVYSQDKNGKYTVRGESIGITTSTTSFYDSDKGLWIKSIINPSDRSGANFLNTIVGLNVTLYDYMDKARNNHLYDFKVTNGSNKVISTEDEYKYRGMPIGKDGSGKTLFSSGRDIGNMAAGIVAAKNGIPWSAARTAFDAYQSRHGFQTEGLSTRNAQYYGWSKIYNRSNGVSESVNLRKSINKFFSKIWKMIF